MSYYPYEAKRRVEAMITSLKAVTARDSEQEVQVFALPVLDAAVVSIRAALPDDPVITAVADLISADLIGSGEPVRAADLLVVAEQIDAAIGPYPLVIA